MTSRNDANTIFLTVHEAEHIRNSVKDRFKKCSKLAGRAWEPRDSKVAISQATSAALIADMSGASGDSLPALAVGQPYPPCIVSFQDLQPMKIADLQMDTHHRGRRLTVKRASPVVILKARSWTVVQDKAGEDTERLEVCLHRSRDGKDVLESASVFVIKEPYFTLTEDGEATLRMDHPSDLIAWSDESTSLTLTDELNGNAKDAALAEKIAIMCKDKGNAALKQQAIPLAQAEYTRGLRFASQEIVSIPNPDLARDLFRNRAHVNLLLNQLDDAKVDAKSSLVSKEDQRFKDLDSRAYFRAGSAAYKLGEYQEAKSFFEEQQKLTPGDKNAIVNLRKCEMRLREQGAGIYDFVKIRLGLSLARPLVDAASFISNTKVSDSPGRGRGLFATRDIHTGEIAMCEKAFCMSWGHESDALIAMTYDVRDDRIRVSPVGLSRSTIQKLLSNPSHIEAVMNLYGDYQGDGKNISRTEDGIVVDTFRIHDIISRNAFSPGSQFGEENASNASTGLWIRASYINHSCVANTKKQHIGDLMVLRASRPITVGEELFHSYEESSDFDARQAALMTTWGFECNCALCIAEKADDPALREKRRELESLADALMDREHWSNAKRLTITRVQRLARTIESTYDGERYKGVPRAAMERIQAWLTNARPRLPRS